MLRFNYLLSSVLLSLIIFCVGFAQEAAPHCEDFLVQRQEGMRTFRNLETNEHYISILEYAPGIQGIEGGPFYAVDTLENGTYALFRLSTDSPSRELIYTFPSEWNFNALAFSPDGTKLAIGISSRGDEPIEFGAAIGIYDLENEQPPEQFSEISAFGDIHTAFSLFSLAWSPDGEYMAATISPTGPEEEIHIFSAECVLTRQPACETEPIERHPAHGQVFPTWSPDSKMLAFICYQTGVCTWDAETGAITSYPTSHDVNALNWSPCSGQLYGWIAEDNGESRDLAELYFDEDRLRVGRILLSLSGDMSGGIIRMNIDEDNLPIWLKPT